jgi:antitoxin FitA
VKRDRTHFACYHQNHMSSMIQIRNVPEELHRELKARAALAGQTLSDYLLTELRALAVRPTMREWLARSEAWTPVEVGEPPVTALAAERSRA